MTRLTWDGRDYNAGVSQGVVYLTSDFEAFPWNGLVSVVEEVSETAETTYYFDGIRNVIAQKTEDFSAAVQAYTYPPELEPYLGRARFGMSYVEGSNVHLIYNALAMPIPESSNTLSNSVDLDTFSFALKTRPRAVTGASPTAHLIFDMSQATAEAWDYLEEMLYGSDDLEPMLPSAEDVLELVLEHTELRIIDFGDGTWRAIGPDSMVKMLDATSFQIDSPSATYLDAISYTIGDYS